MASDDHLAVEPLRRYLSEISVHPLLTASEEVELGRCITAGRTAASALANRVGDAHAPRIPPRRRQELKALVEAGEIARIRFISANLRLVVSMAKRYQSGGLPLLDLIQEGNLGLMRAVDKFDAEKGFKFSTYATWWIRQAMSRALADKGRTIRVPAHVGDAVTALAKKASELGRQLARPATVAELSAATGLAPERILELRSAVAHLVSLSAPIGDGDGELADLIADEQAEIPFDGAAARLDQDTVTSALGGLSARERLILELRFGLGGLPPRTLEDLSGEFGLTRERIRQIEAKALTKLRHPCSPVALRQLVTAG